MYVAHKSLFCVVGKTHPLQSHSFIPPGKEKSISKEASLQLKSLLQANSIISQGKLSKCSVAQCKNGPHLSSIIIKNYGWLKCHNAVFLKWKTSTEVLFWVLVQKCHTSSKQSAHCDLTRKWSFMSIEVNQKQGRLCPHSLNKVGQEPKL